ncbi:unnamed protein product [Vitrella brassicaformis CCMP3155]|uniref:Vacuolar protein sorting-associated protein 29 n=2 Tax=Vitrella brassicaformis TaxID=1169539 RepID=A0A0G4ECX1_VITBC|nr:unnamed protein product [Vitrella brassicaformis CCMP3155]|mmetsp:Transcript_12432/g.29661  ORF Transcript_12432/g.29661 Transcript_12432/m.29661 type:complete len:195 (+) Transcript_12432:134-718(+)|eukprot:CEL93172.1 unnamed protein product [Vitrella brassicaformis CCMP3155]
MGSNFTDFGDLVLLIGDFHIPQRASEMPSCFQELLYPTDKIRHVLCTGNVGSKAVLEQLKALGNLHIVKGDMDTGFDFPETKVVHIGDFKVGLIHGHQVIPWGDREALSYWQRKLDCDVLVSGHTHKDSVAEVQGKFFINPGSATGAFQSFCNEVVPSFMLMAVQGPNIVLYVYQEKEGKASVVMSELTMKRDT